MHRRSLLLAATPTLVTASAPWAAWAQQAASPPEPALQPAGLAGQLLMGRCVVLLRHAQTDAGIGDPPGFSLAQCSSQRNLSPQGRAQARTIGQWFRQQGLQPRQVLSSPWCRCQDTADLAFGRHTVLPALGSTFDAPSDSNAQTQLLRGMLRTVPSGQFDVWVTHQVNVTALSGVVPSMGEGIVMGADGKIRGRTLFG